MNPIHRPALAALLTLALLAAWGMPGLALYPGMAMIVSGVLASHPAAALTDSAKTITFPVADEVLVGHLRVPDIAGDTGVLFVVGGPT